MSFDFIHDSTTNLLSCSEPFQDSCPITATPTWHPCFPDYLTLLTDQEPIYFPDVNAFTRQKDVTMQMRTILLDWLVELSTKFFLKRETVYLTISHIDRLISTTKLSRGDLQLVSLICLHIACKSEEVEIPKISHMLKAGNLSKPSKLLLKLESNILKVLHWQIYPLTSLSCLNVLLAEWDMYISAMFRPYILYVSSLKTDLVRQQDLLNKRLVTFKLENTYSYRRFREAMQILDACVLEYGIYQFRTMELTAGILYVITNKCFFNTKYELFWWNSLVLGNPGENDLLVKEVHNLIEKFLCKIFRTFTIDPLTRCINFLTKFIEMEFDYELPTVCKVLNNVQENYENFLSFQTYSLNNKLFVLRNPSRPDLQNCNQNNFTQNSF